jgi:hypothetical protein
MQNTALITAYSNMIVQKFITHRKAIYGCFVETPEPYYQDYMRSFVIDKLIVSKYILNVNYYFVILALL